MEALVTHLVDRYVNNNSWTQLKSYLWLPTMKVSPTFSSDGEGHEYESKTRALTQKEIYIYNSCQRLHTM